MINTLSTVLISRALSLNSPMKTILNGKVQEILDISFVRFRPVKHTLPEDISGCFFYSPRAVDYFFENIEDPKAYAEGKIMGAMGPGTARKLMSHGIEADLIGQSDNYELSTKLIAKAAGKKILFPVAKNSMHSLRSFVEHAINYVSLEVYDNQPKQIAKLPKADILVFTSPLSVKGYLASGGTLSGKNIVAIGPTTGAFLKSLGPFSFVTAEKPTEESLANSVLSYLN